METIFGQQATFRNSNRKRIVGQGGWLVDVPNVNGNITSTLQAALVCSRNHNCHILIGWREFLCKSQKCTLKYFL